MSKTTVAEGVWCSECEYFEVPDISGGQCMACGCAESEHHAAEVVAED